VLLQYDKNVLKLYFFLILIIQGLLQSFLMSPSEGLTGMTRLVVSLLFGALTLVISVYSNCVLYYFYQVRDKELMTAEKKSSAYKTRL